MRFRAVPLRLFAVPVVLLAFTAALDAQTGTGAVSGTVTDESGAVIPNASVTITNKATGTSRQLTTNAEGLFSAPALLAGEYEVKAELLGFRTQVRDAQVLAGADTTANFKLTPSATRESITVEGATAQINYSSHTVEGSIERQSIQELPLNGRNFTQLATQGGANGGPGDLP